MGMPLSSRPQRRFTLQEFERLRDAAPPGPRHEFLDGEILVTPSPNRIHQRLVLRLAMLIAPFVQTNGLGELLIAPFDVRFEDRTVLQPDLLVATARDLLSGHRYAAHELSLAVEVVSLGSARHDRVRKRPTYQKERVELWLVDPESELVERWRPDDERPEILTDTLSWRPTATGEPLEVDLVELFSEAKR